MACLIRVISFFAILNTTIIYGFQGFGCGFMKSSVNERVKV